MQQISVSLLAQTPFFAMRKVHLVIFAMSLLFCDQAVAQMGGRTPPGGGGQAMRQPPACPPDQMGDAAPRERSIEQINKRLEALQQRLNLTGADRANFEDFAAKTRAFVADDFRRKFGPKTVSISALARLGRQLDEARNNYTALEELHASANRLYAELDETGRKMFDQQAMLAVDGKP
jgi:hypothetical protein